VSNFCPEWIFSVCITNAGIEFLSEDTSIESCAVKYADGLSERYALIEPELISTTTQDLLIFLSEIDAGETAVTLLNSFTYNRLKFEATKKPRKIRSLFGSAFDPTKIQEYSPEKSVKLFKATIFGLRSKANSHAPSGWTINTETNLEWLGELLDKKTNLFDSFLGD
jgi:hypothetical protein